MIYKRCSRCGKRIESGKTCECNKKRYKEYNASYRNQESTDFYNSQNWKRMRQYVLDKYDGLDVYAYVVHGQIEKASFVHHIVELTDDKTQALVERNLIPLSQSSHQLIHKAYDKSEADKKAMQSILYECLRKMNA